MTTDTDGYDISTVLPVEGAESIPAGSNLLISGPAMTGKEQLLFDLAVGGVGDSQGAVAVSTGDPAEDVIGDLRARSDEAEGYQLAAIDCRADGDREQTTLDSGAYVNRVGSPSDLTGIGIGITETFDRFQGSGLDRGRLALSSLSTMLTYTDEKTVFKFCHVLSSRTAGADFLGVFTIDSAAHDEQTLQVIKQAFDGLIEVRDEGTREARLRGLGEPSDWVEL